MNLDLDTLENSSLDELASIVETLRLTDLQIRQSIETAQWAEGLQLSTDLVEWLKAKLIDSDAVSQRLLGLRTQTLGYESQIKRCTDMSMYLLDTLSKHLPIYQRIAAGLREKGCSAVCM
jgi:hypothetical protein